MRTCAVERRLLNMASASLSVANLSPAHGNPYPNVGGSRAARHLRGTKKSVPVVLGPSNKLSSVTDLIHHFRTTLVCRLRTPLLPNPSRLATTFEISSTRPWINGP